MLKCQPAFSFHKTYPRGEDLEYRGIKEEMEQGVQGKRPHPSTGLQPKVQGTEGAGGKL